jgi:hypothetical protein
MLSSMVTPPITALELWQPIFVQTANVSLSLLVLVCLNLQNLCLFDRKMMVASIL